MAGLAGMVTAMLLETWLYIIRTNFEPQLRSKKAPTVRTAQQSPAPAGQPTAKTGLTAPSSQESSDVLVMSEPKKTK